METWLPGVACQREPKVTQRHRFFGREPDGKRGLEVYPGGWNLCEDSGQHASPEENRAGDTENRPIFLIHKGRIAAALPAWWFSILSLAAVSLLIEELGNAVCHANSKISSILHPHFNTV
ncbi:hypothetical protein TREES_T100014541 [Tupaia chinensis]|uniref:Uncharacterized protein n=1 Tax=Tupaia chinensis TaxID=246437 RepID=L9LC00_TUPCH|nr:hypothetical protein TREES_T100014541 [Tupaia chinensis]